VKGALNMSLCSACNLTWNQTTHPPTPWQAFKNGLGCTLLQHPTLHALLTSPTPCQRLLICGACIGTAQVGASLVAPFEFIFKRSSLRSFWDMIIISWYKHLYWRNPSARCRTSQVRPHPRRVYTCMRLFVFLSLLNLLGWCVSVSHDSGKVYLPTTFFGSYCPGEPTSYQILPMVLT